MKLYRTRFWVTQIHRYLGLFLGLILSVIGITGSLLVFSTELEEDLIFRQIGKITPGETQINIDQIFATIQAEVARIPNLTLGNLLVPQSPTSPYQARLWDDKDHLIQLFINPYSGELMGTLPQADNWTRTVLDLHYQLLAGETGIVIAGIAALMLLVLSITGIVLWPGWRKLMAGFKIKWNAHPKRVNFDVHKVVGIITVIFLALTSFTGFCWNFYDWSSAIIYSITLTSPPVELKSKLHPHQAVLPPSAFIQSADTALPNSRTTFIGMPSESKDVVRVGKRQAHETSAYGESEVLLDAYTGKVLRVIDSRTLGLGDRILNSFVPLHYGTFGRLPTRILYFFVGLAPAILLITGFAMWWYRRRNNNSLYPAKTI
jgi:uncharacterized iron-regulated membrane protein